jgi:hypothetical protein
MTNLFGDTVHGELILACLWFLSHVPGAGSLWYKSLLYRWEHRPGCLWLPLLLEGGRAEGSVV